MLTNNWRNSKSILTLLPLDCDDKKSVVCTLSVDEIANSTSSTKPAKFPCIPDAQEARKKRYDGQDSQNDRMREDSATSKLIIDWKILI